jgi:hypothetical protein
MVFGVCARQTIEIGIAFTDQNQKSVRMQFFQWLRFLIWDMKKEVINDCASRSFWLLSSQNVDCKYAGGVQQKKKKRKVSLDPSKTKKIINKTSH